MDSDDWICALKWNVDYASNHSHGINYWAYFNVFNRETVQIHFHTPIIIIVIRTMLQTKLSFSFLFPNSSTPSLAHSSTHSHSYTICPFHFISITIWSFKYRSNYLVCCTTTEAYHLDLPNKRNKEAKFESILYHPLNKYLGQPTTTTTSKKWASSLLQFNKYNMKMSVNAIVFDVWFLINSQDLLYLFFLCHHTVRWLGTLLSVSHVNRDEIKVLNKDQG